MSVCEVVLAAGGGVEVKFYLFKDDLTAAITGDPAAALPAQDAIGKYLAQHFGLTVNGGPHPLEFQALREKNDQVLVIFQSQKAFPKQVSGLTVRNAIFTEKFKGQSNMVYVILPDKKKLTQLFNAGKTEGVFSW